jgi:hypothetical protein
VEVLGKRHVSGPITRSHETIAAQVARASQTWR